MSAQPQSEEPQSRRKRLTLKEAATKVGVSTATIRRRIKDGSLRAYQTMGKFGSQWVISPADLESVTFIPGESVLDFDDPEDPDDPEGPPGSSGPDQHYSTSDRSEVVDDPDHGDVRDAGVAVVTQGPSLEQQALHQAGYWKGRWEEARQRIAELEDQVHSLPALPHLAQQAEASRLAAQHASLEAERLKTELEQLSEDNRRLQHDLQQSEIAAAESKKPWWRRLLRGS